MSDSASNTRICSANQHRNHTIAPIIYVFRKTDAHVARLNSQSQTRQVCVQNDEDFETQNKAGWMDGDRIQVLKRH